MKLRWPELALIAYAALFCRQAYGHSEESGAERFTRATALELKQHFVEAANELEALARDLPADEYTDDALFEAAQLYEERLGNPERALMLYRQILSAHATSRQAARAQNRAEFLARALQSGTAPLVTFQNIVRDKGKLPIAQSIGAMNELLSKNPNFALRDEARLWLATTYGDVGQVAAAEKCLEQILLAPQVPVNAFYARRALGELLLQNRQPWRAKKIFLELNNDKNRPATANVPDSIKRVNREIFRQLLFFLSLAGIIGLLAFLSRAARRAWQQKLPLELFYYFPLVVLFALASSTENSAIFWAVLTVALVGALLVGFVGVIARSDVTFSARNFFGYGISVCGVVVCTVYASIYQFRLIDFVVETLKYGPDR